MEPNSGAMFLSLIIVIIAPSTTVEEDVLRGVVMRNKCIVRGVAALSIKHIICARRRGLEKAIVKINLPNRTVTGNVCIISLDRFSKLKIERESKK